MQIAIASGKGGTGKTTIATNLAVALRHCGHPVQLLDADVEEPNCHLLLHPNIRHTVAVTVRVPVVDQARCTGCGECARICQYGAIICANQQPQVFPALCHSCGGCALLCPEHAISEEPRETGTVGEGEAYGVRFAQGTLNVGEPQAVSVITALRRRAAGDGIVLIDAPPGTSCPVVAAIRGADLVCLVAESTPFGQHDFELAVALTRELGLPVGVVVNRVGLGDDRVARYCTEQGLPILAEIVDDRRLAQVHAEGRLAIEAVPELTEVFMSLAERVLEQVAACRN